MTKERLEQIRHTLSVAQPLLDRVGDGFADEDNPDDFDVSSEVNLYGMIRDLVKYVDYLETYAGIRRQSWRGSTEPEFGKEGNAEDYGE